MVVESGAVNGAGGLHCSLAVFSGPQALRTGEPGEGGGWERTGGGDPRAGGQAAAVFTPR